MGDSTIQALNAKLTKFFQENVLIDYIRRLLDVLVM